MCGVGYWASDLGPWSSTLPVNILAALRLYILCLLQVIGLCDCGGWGLQILHGERDILQELTFTCRNMLLFSLSLSSGQKKKLLNKSDKPQEMAQHINCSNNCIFEIYTIFGKTQISMQKDAARGSSETHALQFHYLSQKCTEPPVWPK